jgi:hypothetical protein
MYQTTPEEINKNAIVERFIRTIKWYIIKLLADPELQLAPNDSANITQQLVQMACVIHNQRYHRIIKAIPINVLLGFDKNKQKIVHLNYPILPVGTIVRLRYTPYKEKLNIKNKVFYYDFNLYVIIRHGGRKCILRELFAYIVFGPGLTAEEQVRVGRKIVTRLINHMRLKSLTLKMI